MNTNSDEGPVAIVTGAASGIGRATGKLLVDRGYVIVAVDRSDDVRDLAGDRIVPLVGSVTDEATNERAVALAEERWGRLDALVLNAGVRASGPIESLDLDVFEESLDVNLRSVVFGIRSAVSLLRRTPDSSIVVTASNTGLLGEANRWPYAAAKAGAINVVRSVAIDLGPYGVRVNAVCPGPTLTGMTSHLAEEHPQRYEDLRRTVPLQRWARAEEVAEAIVWLVSPAASFVTGVALPVDGGVLASTGQASPPLADPDR